MKRIVNILSLISAGITSILIICTFITSYQFYYVGQIFYSYEPIQLGVATTMGLLALRFWINESGSKKFIYSLVSISIAVVLIISMTIVK